MAKKYFIETFGCQMNELDSEKIAGDLQRTGMQPAATMSCADVVILNTCSVREKAVQKVYARLGEIRRLKATRQNLVVGVVGCMAQLEGERILKKAPHVNLLAGPQKGHVMAALVDQAQTGPLPALDLRRDDDPESLEASYILRASPWRAGVTISEGCNRNCSFCVVPFTRGRQRDRESANIIREVEDLVVRGYVEVVLLGQTVNAYRDPSQEALSFAGLLRRLASIDGLKRIRFTSPHPNDFSRELIDAIALCPRICNHVHIPVQSGSTRVLRAMRRGYTRESYLETISRIRQQSRPIAVSTDIIVGFPGETNEDFLDTLHLLDEVQYDSVFSFLYSPRPQTKALEMEDDVPAEEKKARLRVLQERQKRIQLNINAAYVGQAVEVLVDGRARTKFTLSGRMSNNKIVNFDGPDSLLGQTVRVEISDFSANSLKGVWIP
jgi:tRNA-2-methylthio-N6-dimethylallyladenosine synthase